MIIAVLLGLAVGFGVIYAIFRASVTGLDSRNGFVIFFTSLPLTGFLGAFVGFFVMLLINPKGAAVWTTWFWSSAVIALLMSLFFAIADHES